MGEGLTTTSITNGYREKLGFREGDRGTHTSRTIMLAELNLLFSDLPATATREEYRDAVISRNILGKKTSSTRKLSFQRMSELYALNPDVPIYRYFRFLWSLDEPGRPLIAFLVASARDPLLKKTTKAVLGAAIGDRVTKEALETELAETLSNRLNPSIINKVARNARSSWTQAGYLSGRRVKVRSLPNVTMGCVAMALFLGYLTGKRAQRLLTTEWVKLLRIPNDTVIDLTAAAARRGWLDYRSAGGYIEVRYPEILSQEEEEWTLEQAR